jgi:hypothetical protein
MDFIGPLPTDNGYDCILTMTDRMGGADIRLVPTNTTISAEELAALFFEHWYCENGLPTDIISDRDKLFISKFWKALHALTGVKIKMSTTYHPETDGASERTNKSVIQAIRYYVERNQKGWSKALPKIRFDLMNTVNASTGFSGFHLRMGRSPRIISPAMPEKLPAELRELEEAKRAIKLVKTLRCDVNIAKDKLWEAKVSQTHAANMKRSKEDVFRVGDPVLLYQKQAQRIQKER